MKAHYLMLAGLVTAAVFCMSCDRAPSADGVDEDDAQSYADENDIEYGEERQGSQPATMQQQSRQASIRQVSDRREASRLPAGAVVFRMHQLTDPGMNNVPSHTMLIPDGWQVEGGVFRPDNRLYNMPVMVDVKVKDPKTGRQARIFPQLSFEFSNVNPGQPGQPLLSGNMYMPLPQSPGQWIMQMAQSNPSPDVTDLQLVEEKMSEEFTAQLRQQNAQMYQIAQQMQQYEATTGMSAAYDTQATVVKVSYNYQGKPMEETILICWNTYLNLQNRQIASGTWGISLMVSVRDEPGKDVTKDPVLQTIFQSFHPTPMWKAEMEKYWAELARIKHKGNMDRQAQNARHQAYMNNHYKEMNQIISGGWKDRQASSDRIQQQTVDGIHEVTPYQTSGGETVRLPSHYNHVYTDGNGRYLLNNDANYNPNLDPTFNSQNWEAIQQAPAGQ